MQKKNTIDENSFKDYIKIKFEKKVYANDILIIQVLINYLSTENQISVRKKIKKYILNSHENLETLFATNKHNWNDIIENNCKYFSKIMRYLNDRLNSVFKVRVVINKKRVINTILKVQIYGMITV